MAHWRKLFNEKYIGSWDLESGPVTITIAGVGHEDVVDHKGEKETVPVLSIEKTDKKLVLNKTNARTIATLHGDDTDEWVGKKVRLKVERVMAFGSMVDAVRVAADRMEPATK